MIDGTIIRAHRHAAGARGAQEQQELGRSCGALSLLKTQVSTNSSFIGKELVDTWV